jgi:hypothetical protein
VLLVVRHQVIERKTVMARDKVDTLLRLPFLVGIEIRTG